VDVAEGIGVSWVADTIIGIDAAASCAIPWASRVCEAVCTVVPLVSKLALADGCSASGGIGKLTASLVLHARWRALWLITEWASVISLAKTAIGDLPGWVVWVHAAATDCAASLEWQASGAVGTSPAGVTFACSGSSTDAVDTTSRTHRGIAKSSRPLGVISTLASQCSAVAASMNTARQCDTCVAVITLPSNITSASVWTLALSMHTASLTNGSDTRVQSMSSVIAGRPAIVALHVSILVADVTLLGLHDFWLAGVVVNPEGSQP